MSKGKSIHKDITVVALSKMLVNSIDVNKSVVEECTGCWFTDHSTVSKKCRQYDNARRQMMWENGNDYKQSRQFGISGFLTLIK